MFILPFEAKPCRHECGKEECGLTMEACPVFGLLSEPLLEQCRRNRHLLKYLNMLKSADLALPDYQAKLNRGMKGMKNPNMVYPISDNTYVHIMPNFQDIRNHYVPVEPSFCSDAEKLMDKVEERLADYVADLDGINDTDRRVNAILDIVDRIVTIRARNGGHESQRKAAASPERREKPSRLLGRRKDGNEHRGNNGQNGKDGLTMTADQHEGLRYLMKRKLVGLGVLDPTIKDTNIEDISCSGLGNIYLEHKVFGGLRAAIGFQQHEELDRFVIELAETIKRPVTFRDPCVDATLPDGSRINIVYGTDVSKRGSNFTIRKFSDVPLSIVELIQSGSLNNEMAAYLSLIIQDQMNLFVSGETASGKTTLLNAVCTFAPPEGKIVSIEDTPEIQVPHPNWIRGVTRGSAKGSDSSEVTMFDLLKAALRQRPNLIIVGEIRGAEGNIAFQAMQTGHACMSTFHAASVTKLIQRVTGNPINVPKSYVDNLNVVVIAQMVRLPNGMSGRRLTSINEIVGYDSIADAFSFIEVFSWNPLDDTFDFKGLNNSFLLEEKVARRRGIPYTKRKQIYSQIKQRAEVLARIQEQKITNFYEVYSILSKAYREGYFR